MWFHLIGPSLKVPIFNLEGPEDKVFAVDWPNAKLIASGGADSRLTVWRVRDSQSTWSDRVQLHAVNSTAHA